MSEVFCMPHTHACKQDAWPVAAALCPHLCSLSFFAHRQAEPKMKESGVVDNKSGKVKKSEVRTSTGTWFERGQDAVVSTIEKRVAAVTMLPVGELLGRMQYGFPSSECWT